MNLIYDLNDAWGAGENRHAQEVMRDIGITYIHATPQSLFECWQFWCCENVPTSLPSFLREFKADPDKMIGNGLSPEAAAKIKRHQAECER